MDAVVRKRKLSIGSGSQHSGKRQSDKKIIDAKIEVKDETKFSLPSWSLNWTKPTFDECHSVYRSLAQLHHEITKENLQYGTILEEGCHRVKVNEVLDSLVRTILSQNTTDSISHIAFDSLKQSYPTWQQVLHAKRSDLEACIRIGGLAEIKVARILAILKTLADERGEPPSLEYVREMSDDQIKAELGRFKGVGPKTIACVLMFCLNRAEFPVDTHVWHIAKKLKWVPSYADREQTYHHLNARVPNEIKFELHILLVEHGKCCRKCSKGGRLIKKEVGPCPLLTLSKTMEPDDQSIAVKVEVKEECILNHSCKTESFEVKQENVEVKQEIFDVKVEVKQEEIPVNALLVSDAARKILNHQYSLRKRKKVLN
uniref:HhH-GPD domain-containing protein n=1 Tax=Timspurckia oligopyrenoides TaxID=708627 RepID=A0A7S0ZG28_9RHOD|mmetsp:Transcript_3783/g.6612  ORF Transcript_3783/g.6612 Transcript_3783/m.6612 type:complete len:372 (+) Transcript_3783:71-1186(+)